MTYDATYKCGHVKTVNLFGKPKERQEKLEYLKTCLCSDCEKKKLFEEVKELGFPDLQGSEKQIAWGEEIRLEFYKRAVKENISLRTSVDNLISNNTSAAWWIDIRYSDVKSLLEEQEQEQSVKAIENSSEAKLAKDEMTISFKEVKHEGCAEIIVKQDKIIAIYLKDDTFISTVKARRFKWNGEFWYRNISEFTGSIEDRSAEIIRDLLSKGFRVFCTNEEIKERAINGDFKEENDYWITFCDGDLLVKMYKKNDEIYQNSKRLTNSRWDSALKAVAVPLICYQEVLDFGETFGFAVSKSAQNAIRQQIEKDNNNTIVDAKKIAVKENYDYLDVVLTSSCDVLEDLKDD